MNEDETYAELIADLHKSKEAVLITEHGEPSAYLVDVQDYEFMQRRLAILEALSKGERAGIDKRTVTHAQAKKQMAKWLNG